MADTHTSDTLTGGPKQGKRNEIHRHATRGGKDTAGITQRSGGTTHGTPSRAAELERHRIGRRDDDDKMNAMVEDSERRKPNANTTIAHGEAAMGSRNVPISSAASGTKNTTTGPGEAGHNPEPERKGNIYDPEHPDPNSNPKIE